MEQALEALRQHDMPDSNKVWHQVLRRNGFTRHYMTDQCPDCYTVTDFCVDHPNGIYVLALPSHVVCVSDGNYIDTFDSGDYTPIYYFVKEGK